MRILIGGGPRAGKTTLALALGVELGIPVRHTDALIGTFDPKVAYQAVALEVVRWFDAPGDWIVEGVVVPRAIRAWLELHPFAPAPADRVLWSNEPKVERTRGHIMAKGCETVWTQVLPELRLRGAVVESFPEGRVVENRDA